MNLLTTEEAAKALCTSPYTIRRYVKAGLLKASKIGRGYLISEAELYRLINNHTVSMDSVKPDFDACEGDG